MGGWEELPEPLLISIFNQLTASEALACGRVCSQWLAASRDGPLWKRLLCRDFSLKFSSTRLREGALGWLDEYRRLVDETPTVLHSVLHGHTDEVLHVAFSHAGDHFVTCSKDAKVLVWHIAGPDREVQLKATIDMKKEQNWVNTWGGRYNKTDSLLLVAGVINEIDGMISVLDTSNFSILWTVPNNPYDVMGAWVPGNLSGHLGEGQWLSGRMVDFEDEEFDEPCAMVQINTPNPSALKEYPEQRTILKMRGDHYDGTNYLRCLLVSEQTTLPSPHSHSPAVLQEDTKQRNGETFTLVFLCSQSTSVPHQIGFKQFRSEQRNIEDLEAAEEVRAPDHRVELHGHVVGIALDHSGRFLFANVRRWPSGAQPNGGEPPPIAQEIEMVVIDLKTLNILPKTFTGHKGFTDSTGAFYIYLDTSPLLVSSGSEDHKARVWDRHWGCNVATLHHDQCVNCVAFSPTDPQLLVTVSDDKTIKLWMSRAEKRQCVTEKFGI